MFETNLKEEFDYKSEKRQFIREQEAATMKYRIKEMVYSHHVDNV